MKVRCVLIINPATFERVAESPWVRVGQEYTVLEVAASPGRKFSVRLDLDEAPGLWDSEMFETTDPTVPTAWVAQIGEGGSLCLAPPRWLVPGFWERYFDGEADALAVFEEDRRRILGDTTAER